jgi:hypothetical protein
LGVSFDKIIFEAAANGGKLLLFALAGANTVEANNGAGGQEGRLHWLTLILTRAYQSDPGNQR